jgi:hypothetical protein
VTHHRWRATDVWIRARKSQGPRGAAIMTHAVSRRRRRRAGFPRQAACLSWPGACLGLGCRRGDRRRHCGPHGGRRGGRFQKRAAAAVGGRALCRLQDGAAPHAPVGRPAPTPSPKVAEDRSPAPVLCAAARCDGSVGLKASPEGGSAGPPRADMSTPRPVANGSGGSLGRAVRSASANAQCSKRVCLPQTFRRAGRRAASCEGQQ